LINSRGRLGDILKWLYALSSGAFCVWLASFAPAEGPAIHKFIPAGATAIIHVRSGAELLERLPQSPALSELLSDPDVNTLFSPLQRREKILAQHGKAPAPARWLFPAELDSLLPLAGRDFAVATVPSPPDEERDPKSGAPLLLLTHLSGARGQLIRIGATFAKLPKRAKFFDLGGGLVAIGLNGAKPEVASKEPPTLRTVASAEGTKPLCRIVLNPAAALQRKRQTVSVSGQLEILRSENIPPAVLDALSDPPRAHQIFGFEQPPERLEIDVFNSGGALQLSGCLDGKMDAPPLSPKTAAADSKIFADAFLPLNLRMLFLKYIEGEMRLKSTPGLTTKQRRWMRRFDNLADREVDLDKDLWPAAGHAFYLAIQDPTDDLNPAGYGLIRASLPFDGTNRKARNAVGEIVRERWEYLFDGAASKSIKPPYVRRIRSDNADRYVLVTGQITAPSWTVAPEQIAITSDAGPFALMEHEAAALPANPWQRGASRPYYIRLDGPRLARTAEAIASWWYGALEDEIGAHEFLDRHPNAQLEIQLIKKLTRLLGKFSIELQPDASGKSATLKGSWQPEKMAEPVAAEEDAAPPPPPKR